MNTPQQDEVIRIIDRAKHELLALVLSEAPAPEIAPILPDWLTAEQLAERWQLKNRSGDLSTSGLLSWAKRDPSLFPLPHAYMGDLIRFPRIEADEWAKAEAERRRLAKQKTHAQSTKLATDASGESRMRPTLTAARRTTERTRQHASI